MIVNDFHKELRRMSDALRDLGYSDSTIGLRQRYWREYYIFRGSFDVDENHMNEFLSRAYGLQPNNINISKSQYEVRAAIRNLLELHQHGKIINYHTQQISLYALLSISQNTWQGHAT
jgi:hypothetical protein